MLRIPICSSAALLLVSACVWSCGAVYPELSTPIKAARAGRELTPPPPEDLLFIRFKSAEIPTRTRDGRKWDAVGGEAPDPVAKLIVDGKELIATPVQSNTLTPTWPDQKSANYRIRSGVVARVELWDSNVITNHPICVKRIEDLAASVSSGGVEVFCDSGARMSLLVEPAHAKLGVGLYYELRSQSVYVTRVLAESPASRAGVRRGDKIVKIMGKDVATMEEGEARSLINAKSQLGLKLNLEHEDGSQIDVTLSEGPIYLAPEDGIDAD